jgi:hypothetical protein
MSLELKQSQENVNTSNPHSTIKDSPHTDEALGADISVPIPDEKEDAVTKTKDLQPEREATFKDYLVRSHHCYP